MLVTVNGSEFVAEEGDNLKSVLEKKDITDGKGIAVAVNHEVIPKSDWMNTILKPGDDILIITATAGG